MKSSKLYIILLFVVFGFFQSHAQQSPEAAEYKSKADEFKTAGDYINAAITLDTALLVELDTEGPDLFFLADCCGDAGKYYSFTGYYGVSIFYYDLSVGFYQKSGDTIHANDRLLNLREIYLGIISEDYAVDLTNGKVTSVKNVYFRVSEILRQNNDSVWAILDGGSNDGILPGGKGTAIGIYYEMYGDRGNLQLGNASVIKVEANQTTVLVNLFDPGNPEYNFYEGDIVSLPANIYNKKDPGIFRELALMSIDFLDNDSILFYPCRHLLFFDNKLLDELLLQNLHADILETFEFLWPLADDYPAWTEPAKSGRFEGIGMLEALGNSKPEDLRDFLYFVLSYPEKYLGQTWKINETYALWVLNDCPISLREMRYKLEQADDSAFVYLLNKHRSDFYDDSFFDFWYDEAIGLSDNGQLDEAEKLDTLMIRVSEFYQDTLLMAWAYYAKANFTDDRLNYEQAIEEYLYARELFNKAGSLSGQSFASHNSARINYDLGNYSKSLQLYSESIDMKLLQMKTDSSSNLMENMGRSFDGKGSCLYHLNRFQEAIEAFHAGINYYTLTNTDEGTSGKAGILDWLGRVNYTMGNYDTALVYYDQQIKIYKDFGDLAGEAGVYDNIAYVSSLKGNEKLANEQYMLAYELKSKLDDKDGAGFSMSNVGQTYWTLGEYDKAIEAHHLSIELRNAAENIAGQAYSWNKLGDLYKDSGDPKKAIESLNKAIELYAEVDDKKLMAEVYENLGETYYAVKDSPRALENYFIARDIYKGIDATLEYANSLASIGNTYYNDKEYNKAHGYFIESLELQKEIDDRSGQMYNYINLGQVEQFFEINFAEAEKNYTEAIRIAEEIDSKSYIAHCKTMLGSLFSSKGDFEKGLQYYTEAFDVYHEVGMKSEAATILNSMGTHYSTFGKFNKAIDSYNQAKETGIAIYNRNVIISALIGMGHIKYISGEFDESLDLLEESLQISIEVDNSWGIADSYLSLGNTHNAMGDYITSVDYYIKCDSIYKLIGNEYSRATPVNNIGSVYYWQSDYNNALKQFLEALKYIDLPGIEGDFLALVKSNIGVTYFELNNFEESEKWLDQALAIARRGNIQPRLARIQVSRAMLYIRTQKYDAALSALVEADSLLIITNEMELICGLNFFYGKFYFQQGEFEKASQKLQESIDFSKSIGSNKYLWKSLYYQALSQSELGNTSSSIEYLVESVKVLENISSKVSGGEDARKTFEQDENRLDVFEKIVELLIEEERVDEALDYLNRANNENLKTKFGGMNVEFADENKNDALKKEKDLKTKLDKVANEITKEKAKPEGQQSTALIEKLQEIQTVTEKEYMSFINSTVQSYPDLMNYFSSSVNPKEFRAAKRNIPEDVATLLYLIGDGKLYIFVATRDSVDARVVDINNQDLENTIRDFYALLTRPSFKVTDSTELRGAKTLMVSEDAPDNEATFRSLSNNLYDLLLGPVIDEIKEKKKLVIIPNGVLYYLPFQVLGFEAENERLHYLVEDFEILYTNKLRFGFQYTEMEQFKIVALGNADNSLPFAETEVNEIKKIFPDAKVYVRDEATVDKVINIPEDYNILHLATHGVLDYNSFENSYLLLASNPENNDDGKLRIEDIYQIQNLDLYNIVTLSACETAVSFEMLEGWPVTTASAFLDLGVGTVIASLWSVDDEATNILMKSFYENLQTMNKLTALSQAQLSLMNNPKYNHPFYWAPFQFIGDWR